MLKLREDPEFRKTILLLQPISSYKFSQYKDVIIDDTMFKKIKLKQKLPQNVDFLASIKMKKEIETLKKILYHKPFGSDVSPFMQLLSLRALRQEPYNASEGRGFWKKGEFDPKFSISNLRNDFSFKGNERAFKRNWKKNERSRRSCK